MGHKCKASAHILIVLDYDGFEEEQKDEQNDLENLELNSALPITPHISFHALSGILMPQTLRFKGCIGRLNVQILVDRGSTHNFLQSRVVALLNLPVSTKRQFDVMVGNGEVLKCEGLCSAIPVQI